MIERRALLLVGGCAVFAAVIAVELYAGGGDDVVRVGRPIPTENAPAAHQLRSVPPEELVATSIARPLFSPTRRPPESGGSGAAQITDKRLTGIVIAPDRRLAIFAASGAKPLVLTEGEVVDGWRIENITPRNVSLRGPGGTEILQPKLDPNLVPQPRAQPLANRGSPTPAQPVRARAPAAPARAAPNAPTAAPAAVLPGRPALIGRPR